MRKRPFTSSPEHERKAHASPFFGTRIARAMAIAAESANVEMKTQSDRLSRADRDPPAPFNSMANVAATDWLAAVEVEVGQHGPGRGHCLHSKAAI